jgi:RHS repeat-associated protein
MVPGHHPADTAATGHRNTGVPVDRSSSTGRDAEGTRVAKGTITNWSAGCDTTQNGFTMTASYILGPGNEQLAELSWSGGVPTPVHTNVWAGGQLTATYSYDDPINYPAGILYFPLTDWLPGSPATGLRRWGGLGTRRALADQYGNLAQTCDSLPFGDGESCPTTPTEHLFTGKERDSESGNDYFGARYYASSMGRFMSPDWSAKEEPIPYAKLDNPQSLNLYSYVQNNPLSRTDPDGHTCLDPISCGAEGGAVIGSFIEPGGGTAAGAIIGAAAGGAVVGYLLAKAWIAHSENSSEKGSTQQPAPSDASQTQHEATNKAKGDAGVPTSQQPSSQQTVPVTDSNGKQVVVGGVPQTSREQTHTTATGETVVIQVHGQGHTFPDGGTVGPHVHVRPAGDTRHGVVPGTQPHYPFQK